MVPLAQSPPLVREDSASAAARFKADRPGGAVRREVRPSLTRMAVFDVSVRRTLRSAEG